MPSEPFCNETADHGLEEGLGIVHAAEDAGSPNPLAKWLARYPELAFPLANYLAGPGIPIPQPAPTLNSGSAIGGLELHEEIGRGGMGVVHRAFDPVLKRNVAVKLLRTGTPMSARDLAHFRFEAEVVASFDHPNVVRIFSSGEADGAPYLVMPLMTGGSLATRLKSLGQDRQLPEKEAAKIVRDVALGVHHAHQRGLIHRDLKPGNILLDESNTPHVADFGLARRTDVSEASSAGIAGTVAYMAPEQARGEKQLTTAVDVHALGVILFELLTGGLPYGGIDIASMLRRLTDESEPVPLVSRFRPGVDADLEAICFCCLCRTPQDRYPSALALADALDRFLAGEPQLDSHRRGWRTGLTRALGWRRETASMGSWWTPFWGAASTLLALMGLQAAVLLDAPTWVVVAVLAYYFCAWAGIVEWMKSNARGHLNSVERTSAAIQYGMMFACLSLVPVHLWHRSEGIASVTQSFAAIVGLGVFAHGATYWGKLYIAGLLFIVLAACLPLIPTRYWPGAYGLFNTAFQLWVAVHLLRVHRATEAARIDRASIS